MHTYDSATQILLDCAHANATCEVTMGKGQPRRLVCCACWNAHVYARREADKARRQAEPKDCMRCGNHPHRWNYGGYQLCGRCKTATEREHNKALAGHGVLGIFATQLLVKTDTWAMHTS